MNFKTCEGCCHDLPLADFSFDGANPKCRKCVRKDTTRRYRQSPKGKASDKRSGASKAHKKAVAKYRATAKHRAAQRAYWNSDTYKAARRARRQTEHHKILHRLACKRDKNRHPDRYRARAAINNAIKAGKMSRADSHKCQCGKPAEQYHHHRGYAPEHVFDVIPLCVSCHESADHQAA